MGQEAHLGQGWTDQFRIGSFWQKELAIVFSVDGFGFRFLFVFGVDQQLVVDCFHDDLFRRVLGNVETQFQFLLFTIFLDQWRVKTSQPVTGGSGQSAAKRKKEKKNIISQTMEKRSILNKQHCNSILRPNELIRKQPKLIELFFFFLFGLVVYLCRWEVAEEREEAICSLTSPIHLRASVVCIL